MADYVANNTRRLRVEYTGPRGTHHMIFRNSGLLSSEAGLIASARDIATLMVGFQLDGTSWVSAEAAAEGSDIFLPVAWGAAITSSSGVAANNATQWGAYLNFVGRSSAGSRVTFYMFNVQQVFMTANNRLTVAEQASLQTLIDAINSATSELTAIDRQFFTLKNYANTGINDHVGKKARVSAA